MTDKDTADAIAALASRIRNRDAAIRDGEDHPDAELFAAEFLTALRGRGWRVTEAKPMPAWNHQRSGGTPPDADSPGVAAYREARLDLEHRLIEAGAMDYDAAIAHTYRVDEHLRIEREGSGTPQDAA